MPREYNASSIKVITNDRDRLRKRPLTYIPTRQKEGAISVYFEILDNSLDEVSVKGSVGKNITATFDTKTKEMSVLDDGSGIPLEKLYDVCTIINSSGKFDNDESTAYTYSGGLNGVGLKACVYLSKYAVVKSTRDGKSLTYKFKDGILEDTIKAKESGHGTYVKFRLDPEFADPTNIDPKELVQQFSEKSYLFPNITIRLDILNNGKLVKSHKFNGKDMTAWINDQKPDTAVIGINNDVRTKVVLTDISDENLKEQKVIINLVFGYKEDTLDADDPMKYIISFANTIRTTTGGSHVDGMKLGIQKWFKQQVIPNMKGKDKDLSIMPVDMVSGLCAFVWVQLASPDFRGQFKDQLNNPEAKFTVRDAVYDALCDAPSSLTKSIVDFVKRVTRGRMASKKTRKKDISNAFSKDRIDKFKDINYNLDTSTPELILVEGDSAADNAATARDANNQAIYGIARPANLLDMDSEQVEKIKGTFNNVLDICGIQPGKKCDPEKSTMRYILVMTDGDVDGDSICNSVVCLLAKHCKPLIDAGMVGRILPPAYSIPAGKGKKVYVRSQREFFDKVLKKFLDDTEVTYKGRKLSKKELRLLVEKNFDYDTELDHLAERNCCSSKLMEYIAWHYHGHNKDQKKSYWMTKLKPFSGISVLIENGMIILDGEPKGQDYINIAFDEYFDRHVYRFKKYQQNNTSIDGYTIDGKPDKTLYDVMHLMRTYIPRGVERFKGLGELDKDEMKTLCMDPKTRTVVIFKFKDFENDLEKINVIMSTKKMYAQARQQLILQTRLSDLDLDT